MCEEDVESSPYLKLERMKEEARGKQRRKSEVAQLEKDRALQWVAELEALEKRRRDMSQDEIDAECEANFASASYRPVEQMSCMWQESFRETIADSTDGGASPSSSGAVSEEEPGPEKMLHEWLATIFPSPAETTHREYLPHSIGEISDANCHRLAESLVDILCKSADAAESAVAEAPTVRDAFSELDAVIEKYADTTDEFSVFEEETGDPEMREAMIAAIKEIGAKHRAAAKRLQALLPVLEGDVASTRFVVSLTLLAVGDHPSHERLVSTTHHHHHHKHFLQSLTESLTTADVCWGALSEKKRLLCDRMLDAFATDGQWTWKEMRRLGVAWWLRIDGPKQELLDFLVTKMAQTATVKLRRHASRLGINESMTNKPDQTTRRMVDEALFWYVLLGADVKKLRALLKTGVLQGCPDLTRLVNHPKCGEEQFMRKNAFKLLAMHRYYLAAALFALIGAHGEAARVVAGHLRDLQLVVLLTRKCPEAAAPINLERSSLADRDPWLRLMLDWHTGVEFDNETGGPLDDEIEDLFDGCLRPAHNRDNLNEVARRLLTTSANRVR